MRRAAKTDGGQRREFFIPGEPAPQGSKRHVGNGVMIESSKKVKPWREAVKWAVIECRAYYVDGPVRVSLDFLLRKPPSVPKSRTLPDRKPDLDKLIRSTLDGLWMAGCFEDDARVVGVTATKRYAATGETTGACVVIEQALAAVGAGNGR